MHYDINRVPADGYLILPLSMSRLATSQSAENCYEILDYFEQKLTMISLDVVLLYTNGLYYNSEDTALNVRRTTNEQMITHRNALQNLILKNKRYAPQAFHYLPWDYVLLNAPSFGACMGKLRKEYARNDTLRTCMEFDLSGRGATKANIDFLFEEVVATHLIRQKMIELPKTLVQRDTFRLVVYPGPFIQTDLYQYTNRILDRNPKLTKDNYPWAAAHYDFNQKIMYDFERMIQGEGSLLDRSNDLDDEESDLHLA